MSCLPSNYDKIVIASKHYWKEPDSKVIQNYQKVGNVFIKFFHSLFSFNKSFNANNNAQDKHESETSQERYKVRIIPLANASTYPWTMVIKDLHSVVTVISVISSGRTNY